VTGKRRESEQRGTRMNAVLPQLRPERTRARTNGALVLLFPLALVRPRPLRYLLPDLRHALRDKR